jgi:hypothetical protein
MSIVLSVGFMTNSIFSACPEDARAARPHRSVTHKTIGADRDTTPTQPRSEVGRPPTAVIPHIRPPGSFHPSAGRPRHALGRDHDCRETGTMHHVIGHVDHLEKHWIDLMQVAISISEGRLSSATLMRRLRSNSRKNRIYKAFREVGRSVRTVALLRYLADPALRARVTAATNKVESYNGFSKWLGFGGVLADNDPEEQEKLIKFNTLLANLVVFHNALDISDVVRQLVAEGWSITADQLGQIAPYLRAHISRFGAYATDELRHRPDPFDPLLKEVDFADVELAA